MKPKRNSKTLLGVTRSKGKMYEYGVPEESHIDITTNPARLFSLSIGILGDAATSFINEIESNTERDSILFSAYFLDAYTRSLLEPEVNNYVSLLASSAYFLANLPGSAQVMAKQISKDIWIQGSNSEKVLLWLLLGQYSFHPPLKEGDTSKLLYKLMSLLDTFQKEGSIEVEEIESQLTEIRKLSYEHDGPRDLLLKDLIAAVSIKRIQSSSWINLPKYSDIPSPVWKKHIKKATFIRELWPSQIILGEKGVFRGKSAVIQMPTSAGKTKSIELIIRCGFLAKRTSIAVVVAPFKALCHEIRDSLKAAFEEESIVVDELSDVYQDDFDFSSFEDTSEKKVLVLTPEKLIYVLRQDPELAPSIGLLIFDEAHQFDSGIRGVTYELLLSTLKMLVGTDTQKVLISAVIENADVIGTWLNGTEGVVVSSLNLLPTYRTLGFASWKDLKGRIEFVDINNIDNNEFFVPRVIESNELKPLKKKRKKKNGEEPDPDLFPEKNDSSEIALYLGLKLFKQGAVAIFCGQKKSAIKLSKKLIELKEKKLDTNYPASVSNKVEIRKIVDLIHKHLGQTSVIGQAAEMGILNHHANVPQGVRLAVEHAMRNGQANFVLCTSTLAQGVNLPIRYLIFSNIYQAGSRLKIRDFHNLIGRAGRAGMHTEGSILFADPKLFDGRKVVYSNGNRNKDSWEWSETKKLVDSKNSEPCESNILRLFSQIKIDKNTALDLKIETLMASYFESATPAIDLSSALVAKNKLLSEKQQKALLKEIRFRIQIVQSIESHLLANLAEDYAEEDEINAATLAKETLAYAQADKETKKLLIKTFSDLAENINEKTNEHQRTIFKKTLLGLADLKAIEEWVDDNRDSLNSCDSESELLDLVWPLVEKYINNSDFRKLSPDNSRQILAKGWAQGKSYSDILESLVANDSYLKYGTRRFGLSVEHIVDICDNGVAYDGMLIISVIAEILENDFASEADLIEILNTLQKNLKYGLKGHTAVKLYELGFHDRIVATELSQIIGEAKTNKHLLSRVKANQTSIINLLSTFPSYFTDLKKVLTI